MVKGDKIPILTISIYGVSDHEIILVVIELLGPYLPLNSLEHYPYMQLQYPAISIRILFSRANDCVYMSDTWAFLKTIEQTWCFSRTGCWNHGSKARVWWMQIKFWHILLCLNLVNLP